MLVSSSPHIRTKETIESVMYAVVLALMPALLGAIYFFGLRALFLTALAVVSAVLTEYIYQKITRRPITALDGSAIVTGILLAFNIPVNSPWWLP
ncbi:hypothetical protein DRQ18_03690, partial [bacterium]